jgi:cellulose synthase/poly-beta-1,6-N-acetylglucosamine synthase-like glycosyltransferase
MNTLILTAYWLAIGALAVYGLNCYVLSLQFMRLRRRRTLELESTQDASTAESNELPFVTVQLPVYNERLVIDRLIESTCAIRYPADRFEIQVLDDSNDETTAHIAKLVTRFRSQGVDIAHLHRPQRTGYKAGALAEGLAISRGEWIAIFDSDFVPGPDFLERTAPFFNKPDIGVVQCRWEHLDRDYNALTKLQGLAIDGHFGVEQAARSWSRWFLNFNGTAGIWRRQAIDEAGGWEGDTLTEDLDLSYRAQLKGWRIEFLLTTGVPAEIPADMASFKSQQRRWAKGSIQTARKLLGRVLRADLRWTVKIQAVMHLTHYLIHPLMLIVALLSVPVHFPTASTAGMGSLMAACLLIGTCGPTTLYVISQKALGRRSRRTLRSLPTLMLVGTGIALSNSVAVAQALWGKPSEFVRTPKRRVVGQQRAVHGAYSLPPDRLPFAEIGLACWTAAGCVLHLNGGYRLFSPFLLLYAAGFATVAIYSIRESRERSLASSESEVLSRLPDTPGQPKISNETQTPVA